MAQIDAARRGASNELRDGAGGRPEVEVTVVDWWRAVQRWTTAMIPATPCSGEGTTRRAGARGSWGWSQIAKGWSEEGEFLRGLWAGDEGGTRQCLRM